MTQRNLSRSTALNCLVALLLSACTTSPTGRSQITLIPDMMIDQIGVTTFNDIRRSTAEVSDGFVSAYVNCVADAIVRELPPETRDRGWQVVVFADDTANAFAVPGGRIGVHEGLLRVAEDQHQLATVIGHEIAHVIARHANERMSTTMLARGGLQALDKAMANSSSRREIMTALGLGAQYGALLPYNRVREAEADVMGLEFMARAGFDPRASILLWENMARDSGGAAKPEFMSTHPSHDTRIEGLGLRVPEAMDFLAQARSAGRVPECDRIRQGF